MRARRALALMILPWALTPAHAEEYLVRNQSQFLEAVAQLQAGDEIILADGEWKNFDIILRGQGSESRPILLRPETPGKTIITGQSSLRIGGRHIHVSGLVFRDGYSPRGEVISFRIDKDDVAFNSRISHIVIDGFSKPGRYESDYWVTLYGKSNRFDHSHLVGKSNKGVTLAVKLDTKDSRENGHRIDFNYFGPRPVLGSNGGETLRIGTSAYSMFTSGTIVENNVFDRCDGEVEIISSKSAGNVFRGNLFLRSRGNLTLRHGDNNVVERNVFLGYGKEHTGGIRVINRKQTIRQNYMEGLRGEDFSSALAVMNGVPNSPVNRYVEVSHARIENNTIVDSRRVAFNVGSDEERSVAPSDTTFQNNLLGGLEGETFIEAYGDVSGIAFKGNLVVQGRVDPSLPLTEAVPIELTRAKNGLLYPVAPDLIGVGAPSDLAVISIDAVGVDWYAKPGSPPSFGSSGRMIDVSPGVDTLLQAIAAAKTGDVIRLQPGEYVVDRTIPIKKPVSLRGPGSRRGDQAIVFFSRPSLFELRDGGSLRLSDLVIDGALAPDSVGNSVIRTTVFPMRSNVQVEIDNVTVRNLTVNRSFNVLTLGKSTLADYVTIKNSNFADLTGAIVSAAAENEDFGQYNLDYLAIIDSNFANIGGPIANIYRGGRDESTFGPSLDIEGNTLSNVGEASDHGAPASIRLHGVQAARIANNSFADSAPLKVVHTAGTPKTSIINNRFTSTAGPVLEELYVDKPFRGTSSGNSADGNLLE